MENRVARASSAQLSICPPRSNTSIKVEILRVLQMYPEGPRSRHHQALPRVLRSHRARGHALFIGTGAEEVHPCTVLIRSEGYVIAAASAEVRSADDDIFYEHRRCIERITRGYGRKFGSPEIDIRVFRRRVRVLLAPVQHSSDISVKTSPS